jgi:hypothetical protein
MADPIYKPDDYVSLARWDRSERPANKMGDPGFVLEVITGCRCESGVMVRVRGNSGTVKLLDQNWLEPFKYQSIFEI